MRIVAKKKIMNSTTSDLPVNLDLRAYSKGTAFIVTFGRYDQLPRLQLAELP